MTEKDLSSFRKDYNLSSLRKSFLEESPFLQFDKWFQEAVSFGDFEANAMTLATVNSKNQPSARIVLLKKYSAKGFIFYTNYESKKGQELIANSKASLLFFWEKMQRQIRIEGVVEKISEEDSIKYFSSRPLQSQIAAAISPQSQIIPNREFLEKRYKAVQSKNKVEKPEKWGGFCLKPNYLEFWQGGAHRLHDRLAFQKETNAQWKIIRLAP
ncbi:MAG: pyridoxamine 5'-phosphate oxidase [Chitinophagales bacterium]